MCSYTEGMLSRGRFLNIMKSHDLLYHCILRHIRRETPEAEEEFIKDCERFELIVIMKDRMEEYCYFKLNRLYREPDINTRVQILKEVNQIVAKRKDMGALPLVESYYRGYV